LRAYSNANVATRVDASSVMIFRLSTTGDHFVLEPGVEILGVLAHDHEVDPLVA
jgi:hypothetical protein